MPTDKSNEATEVFKLADDLLKEPKAFGEARVLQDSLAILSSYGKVMERQSIFGHPEAGLGIVGHQHHLQTGIAILQGPPGSGKTTIIKTIIENAHKLGKKVVIVTDSNAAADNVIDKIVDVMWISTRVHSI